MSSHFDSMSPDELTQRLTYAGFVLVGFELLKSMIVNPTKAFYANMTFSGTPFSTYEKDVRCRAKDEFEACLLYLRDFMGVITTDDIDAIQELRRHRNLLAHDLPALLPTLRPSDYRDLWQRVDHILFDLSNYRTRVEIGADPEFQGTDWDTLKGPEYSLFESIVARLRLMS